MRIYRPTIVRWIGTLSIAGILLHAMVRPHPGARVEQARSGQVAGTGTDLLNGAIVHSKRKTSAGLIQRSTETVELRGDLSGKVLYHVTSTFDLRNGTLVSSLEIRVFSGTVADLEPVMIHDGKFRFGGEPEDRHAGKPDQSI